MIVGDRTPITSVTDVEDDFMMGLARSERCLFQALKQGQRADRPPPTSVKYKLPIVPERLDLIV